MNSETPSLWIWFKRSIGATLALVVLLYMFDVAVEGGVVNPHRPKTERQLKEAMMQFSMAKQTPDEIFRTAAARTEKDSFTAKFLIKEHQSELQDRFDRHRRLAEGSAKPRAPYHFAIGNELKREVEFPLADILIVPSDVELKTALYVPSEYYEALSGSNLPPEPIFRSYLTFLHERKWMFEEALYDERSGFGSLSAESDRWSVEITVWNKSVFPRNSTVVHWKLAAKSSSENRESDQDE